MKPYNLRMAVLFGLALAAVLAGAPQPAAGASRSPNVLFLFSDDQRCDTISALGNQHIQTPNLDRLSREGVVFTRAYIMGAMQGAVCVPSRAMLMTGRSLFKVKENMAGQATWPQRFRQAGYRTFITGKWHNQPEALLRSFGEGSTIFLGGMGNPYRLPVQDISPEHTLVNLRTNREHSIQQFADAAIQFLRRQDTNRPFLCYVAFNAPHDPRVAPTNYHLPYSTNPPPIPPNFKPQHPFNNGDMEGRDEMLAPWPRTPEIVRRHLGDYYSYITFLDAQIGRVLDELRAGGQQENTIVVFSSDNGLAIGSHGLFGKQNVYEHSIHQPLIFCGPGIPRGKRSDAFCYLFDVFPTLGEFCGVDAPEGSEGQSLVPFIREDARKREGRGSIFSAYRRFQRAVRDDRWKLILYPQINKLQLFDLQNDPFETVDLSSEPRHRPEVERLRALLAKWQRELGDEQALETQNPQPIGFDPVKANRKREARSAK